MNLLLDTHSFLWWDFAKNKLSGKAIEACESVDNVLILSLASVWEIQIKFQLGKLQLRLPLPQLLDEQRLENNLVMLPIALRHILALESVPIRQKHRDPFDRLLIAQAMVEDAVLITNDAAFQEYGINVLW